MLGGQMNFLEVLKVDATLVSRGMDWYDNLMDAVYDQAKIGAQ